MTHLPLQQCSPNCQVHFLFRFGRLPHRTILLVPGTWIRGSHHNEFAIVTTLLLFIFFNNPCTGGSHI
jgi:hypothetical protein